MGAWADGLAAQSKKEKERSEKHRKRREKFRKKFLELTMLECVGEEIKRSFTIQEMYLLCLYTMLANQRAMLEGTTARSAAMGDTAMMMQLIEHMMLEKE